MAPQSLPVLYASGTHYQVGFTVGQTFASNIKRFLAESTGVQEIDIPFYNSDQGKNHFNSMLEICKTNFPQYVQEIQGMADGAGINFDDLFKLSLSKEVHNILAKEPAKAKVKEMAGCTDIFINKPTCKILGHNEDCDPKIKPYGYILSACILDDEDKEVENFTAYCYPGVLPGTAFSFNKHGMVFTVDGLYPNFIVPNAPPRMFLNRNIIKARSLDEAVELIENKGFGVAYGFTVNIADVRKPKEMWSIEISPQANASLYHIHKVSEQSDTQEPCHYIHINSFKHLTTPQVSKLRSSEARTKRTEELPAPENREDVLNMLGDEGNQDFPIYRTPRPTDLSITACTVVFDLLRNRADVYTDNPSKEKTSPLLHFSILDL
ncbi:beta-alanyl-dopamine/carcinine hydrolase-like isoform X2 [Physella acuta]|nr:beta-alanyl-dopamine/carcinine hydrolase-like isoform X2 [Physella acuta]XP_059151918.1 beta-alanyl-dopamine/carcinine hydrolase-like isoform X2 [Physella acuta]XP_059151919.1 beta-alanyl-dopamine/carcinine hydrolase-like isoform X2 [Physella acuta]XP_059151920.1 beta-alanyl-dopamine/carcinine hydrolase-like isoform X2 [Physella acuta]